jgi:ABC-type thiamin/hydroxymethylpyrimidine transport system permease subunit
MKNREWRILQGGTVKTFTTRDWVYIAVFGALWGAIEITLGAYLHVIFPPLADTFLVGVIMAGVGSIIALTGRHFVPRTGSVLMIGVVTALLKALSLGGVKIGPMVAILAESLLIEVGLLAPNKFRTPSHQPSRWGFALAGALAVSWNFFHKFVMMRLLFGRGVSEVAVKMVKDSSKLLDLDVRYSIAILAALLFVRLIVGAVAGWLAWDLGGAVRRRLAREG